MLCLFLQIIGRIKIMSSHFCKNIQKKRKKQVNNGVGRSCACSLVLGLKSPKAKTVLYRFVFKVAKIQLEPLWISTNGGAKSCRQGRTKRDVGASPRVCLVAKSCRQGRIKRDVGAFYLMVVVWEPKAKTKEHLR